jgi:DNA-binding CsgD family transcriptional regulator/PAS domain-containing protein
MGRAGFDILSLVGQLHEGVADEESWDRALDDVSDLLAIRGLLLGVVNGDGTDVHFEFGHNARRDMVSLLEGPLNDPAHNPWLSVGRSHPLRRPATADDLGGGQAFQPTEIWSDFCHRYDLGESLGAVLERQPEFAHVIITGRRASQPDFDSADRRAFAVILPHVARAWRVKRMLAEWKEKAGTLKFVLDRLDRAILVTGPEGQIRFANRAADRLLSRGDGIDATRGRLRAERSRDTDALRRLIDRASRTSVGAGQVAVDAVSVACSNDSPALAIVAEPLAPGHSDRLGHSAAPGAVLFIGDSEASNRPSIERLRIVYGLTPAEARLTSLIVQGHGVASAADELGVSRNTTKYHLKTVFEKIGVTRQTQLVRRVLADVGGLAEPETMRPSASSTELDERHEWGQLPFPAGAATSPTSFPGSWPAGA